MTLLFVAGCWDREDLLEALEAALEGGQLAPSGGELLDRAGYDRGGGDEYDDDELEYGEHELDGDEEEFELEDEEEYEEEEKSLINALPPVLLQSQGITSSYQATAKGFEFLFIAATLERWLRRCPSGSLELGEMGADAIALLACCWSATVTHALAAQPLTLRELHRIVNILDYETTEEHVRAMEAVGQVEPRSTGGETQWMLTDWMREGIGPIVAAARYEAHFPEDDVLPPDVLDVDAAFQLALPLVQLPPDLRGTCRLGVQIPGEEPLMAGATATVDRGRTTSCSNLLEQEPCNWATGSPVDWMDTVTAPTASRLRSGGDVSLANALVLALSETLFGDTRPL